MYHSKISTKLNNLLIAWKNLVKAAKISSLISNTLTKSLAVNLKLKHSMTLWIY